MMLVTIIGGLALVLFLVWLVNEEKTRNLEKEMKKSVEQHIKDTENILLSFLLFISIIGLLVLLLLHFVPDLFKL